jgi:Domain of unknown function (DUF4383)
MDERSPAELYTLVIGVTLVALGVLGFFYNASFGSEREALLGIVDVNGWLNLLHIGSGAVGLAVAGSYEGARAYALATGALYVGVAILGFAAGGGEEMLGLMPADAETSVLHLLIGVAGAGAGLATPATEPAPA